MQAHEKRVPVHLRVYGFLPSSRRKKVRVQQTACYQP